MIKNFLAIFAVLIVGVFGYSYFQSQNSLKGVDGTKSIQNVEIKTEDKQVILLYPLSGDVTFKNSQNSEFEKATTSPTVIPNQAIVHTGVGKASILLPDNSSISLEENTELMVNYSEKEVSIIQSFGVTYHRVEALLTGKSYQVKTPGTLAAVRGTKFAVRYDKKTKKTKVSVTEHKVLVEPTQSSDVKNDVTKETPVFVDEGKTVSVGGTKKDENHNQILTVVDTKEDVDMRVVVDNKKKEDLVFDDVKNKKSNKEELREEFKKIIFEKTKENKNVRPLDDVINEIKNNLNKESEVISGTKPVVREEVTEVLNKDETKIIENEDTLVKEVPVIVTKIDEEEFFSKFEPLFIDYFYLDEEDTACKHKALPEERVRVVKKIAVESGYPITSTSLLSFAQAVNDYCLKKDANIKIKLQARFDDEYPF